MKKMIWILIAVFCLGSWTIRAEDDDQYKEDENAIKDVGEDSDANASVAKFKDELAPSGRWVQVKAVDYDWVWVPDVQKGHPDWRPYIDGGHWVWTDAGWYWESDYAWGATCFHYGRWVSTEFGWAWVPGSQWAPAWVCWRECDGYYGWAPLPPCTHYSVGLGFYFHGKHCAAGFEFGLGVNDFCFVGAGNFLEIDLVKHRCHHDECVKIYNTTVIRNTYVYRNGHICAHPFRKEAVEAHVHVKIEARAVAKEHHERRREIEHGARHERNQRNNKEEIRQTREGRQGGTVIKGQHQHIEHAPAPHVQHPAPAQQHHH